MNASDLDSRVRELEKTKSSVLSGAVVGGVLILAFMGLTSYVQIPDAVREEVNNKIGANVLDEIRRRRDAAAKSAERATEYATQAEAALANIDGGLLRIESGRVRAHEGSFPDLRRTDSCEDTEQNYRGLLAQRVHFDRSFAETPTVVVALAYLDHVIVEDKKIKPNNLRIKAEVREVDSDGFDFDLITWCNTDIYGVEMTWVAYGRSAP